MRARQVRPIDDLALDILDALGWIDTERIGNIPDRLLDATVFGPDHDVIAAQTGLVDDVPQVSSQRPPPWHIAALARPDCQDFAKRQA